jgi:hypothetical protein
MPVLANSATGFERPAEDDHSDDAVNRSQRFDPVGGLKHVGRLSVAKYLLV